MITEDAINIKDKLEEVLIVIDEYGKQAKQFAETRQELADVIKQFSKTNDAFTDAVINSDEFLKCAQKLIDIDYTKKIKEKLEEVSTIESNHQTQCEDTFNRLESLAAAFNLNSNDIANTQKALQEKIEALIEKIETLNSNAEDAKKEILQAFEKFETRIGEKQDDIISTLPSKENCENQYNQIMNSLLIQEKQNNELLAKINEILLVAQKEDKDESVV